MHRWPSCVLTSGFRSWADLGNLHQGGRAGSGGGQGGASRHERRRREPRQTRRRAEGVGLGEGVSPPQWGRGLRRGTVPPPQKIFEFLISNWRIFMDFESITWQLNTTEFSIKRSSYCQREWDVKQLLTHSLIVRVLNAFRFFPWGWVMGWCTYAWGTTRSLNWWLGAAGGAGLGHGAAAPPPAPHLDPPIFDGSLLS